MSERFRFHTLDIGTHPGAEGEACAWVRSVAGEHGIGEETAFHIELCVAEVVANAVQHAYGEGEGPLRLELLLDADAATLTAIDTGPEFDPLAQAAPPLPDSVRVAPTGGLGLHLVRQFADSVHYERDTGGHNRVTLRFGRGAPNPEHVERRGGHVASFPLTRSDGTRIDVDERDDADRRALASLIRSPLFRDVPYRDFDAVVAHCEVTRCAPGEVVFRAGESHRCVLVVVEGTLGIHLEAPDKPANLELGPGECVGELSVADGKPTSAWVVAASPCRLLVIPDSVFLESVLGIPAIARNLIIVLSERMRRNNAQIVARLRESLELEALQRELDTARQIQSSMLPAPPLFHGQDVVSGAGYMRAARQVGGDFYDAFPIGEGRFFAAIGDVCNKGMPAALFMARAITLVRSEALRTERGIERHLARLAGRCNALLCESNEAQLFVSLFCAVVDTARERVHYVNLGHNAPVVCAPDADPVMLAAPRNPIAGLVPDLVFKVGNYPFRPGSLLLLYTDGVTEAEAADDRMFGEARLLELLASPAMRHDPGACVRRIMGEVDAFTAGQAQSDDITLLAVARA